MLRTKFNKNIEKIIVVSFLLLLISSCNTHKENHKEVIQCTIEPLNSKTAWTVIEFEEFEFVRKYKLDDICPIEDTYPGFQEGFRDLQIFKDMCFKREALISNNVEVCKKAETCFIKNYCVIEINIKNYENYCTNKEAIEKDYCEIISLRDNHGYRPTFSADCSDITDTNLKTFCEIAYRRKE